MSNTLKESFQVYAAFCEGVAALVNMFFDLTRPARALACNILKRASKQSQELHQLYEHCKSKIMTIGNHKNLEYPSVQIISIDHVLALEQLSSSVIQNVVGQKPPAILDYLTKSTKKMMQTTSDQCESTTTTNTSLPTLFSCTLETKISKVWVVFDEEEEPTESHDSIDRLFIKGTHVSNLSL